MIFVIGGRNQGQRAFAETVKKNDNTEIIDNFHLQIKDWIKQGEDVLECTEKICEGSGDVIICSDEIGNGIVPIDPFDREYREVVGRTHIRLAEASDEVYRVICGVGQKIK